MIIETLNVFFVLSTLIIGVYLVRHYFFTLTVLRHAKIKRTLKVPLCPQYEPTVSILLPAHNEEKVVGKLLQNMAEIVYPRGKLEVILIDDASTDQTGKVADDFSKQYPFIKVLHREHGVGGKGKAAALNAALPHLSGEIVLCFDADYIPHPDLVHKLADKFVDPSVGAVQGRPVVLNEPHNLVTRLIALERIGGYRVDQEARDTLGLVPQFGGTVGGFRRSILEGLGGFDESMLTEDTDLTFQIYLEGYKVRYVGDAECYEEAVDNWRSYWRQRYRWAKGHMQVCFKHAFSVVESRHMSLREKIDGLLLLHIYFMPLITLFSFCTGIALILSGVVLAGIVWFAVPISFYSVVGNYAPFFEIGVGAYLDGRTRIQWLMPLLFFSYIYNCLICSKAFMDLLIGKVVGHKANDWGKTDHLGNGNRYIGS